MSSWSRSRLLLVNACKRQNLQTMKEPCLVESGENAATNLPMQPHVETIISPRRNLQASEAPNVGRQRTVSKEDERLGREGRGTSEADWRKSKKKGHGLGPCRLGFPGVSQTLRPTFIRPCLLIRWYAARTMRMGTTPMISHMS